MCHFADVDNVKTIVPSLLPTSIHQEIVRYLLAEDATTTTIKLLQRPQLLLFITDNSAWAFTHCEPQVPNKP
jgi:hypothetical protein